MQKKEQKFVKVLTVNYSNRIEDRNFVRTAIPDLAIAYVVDTEGDVSVIRTTAPINVGDEIDIVSEVVKEFGIFQPEVTTVTKVLKNHTQEQIIKDFVDKNKSKTH